MIHPTSEFEPFWNKSTWTVYILKCCDYTYFAVLKIWKIAFQDIEKGLFHTQKIENR